MEAWLKPMLCQPADVAPEGDEWIYEKKINGWRCVMRTTPEGVLTYGGRNGSDYSGKVPYVEAEVGMILPPDSAVDGELVGVGLGRKGWGDVQGVMTRGGGPHVPSVADPALVYIVWDVMRVNGTDARSLPWSTRRMLLEQASWEFATHVQITPTFPATDGDQAVEAAIGQGFEGLVAKRRTATYVNTRSWSWVKIKRQLTAEGRIVGFKAGKAGGKFDGKVGAFEVEMLDENDQPTGARTTIKCGHDDRHREAFEHPERWLHVVIELHHHGIGDTGVPLNPQFYRRRDDRTPATPTTRRVVANPKGARVLSNGQPSGRNYGAMGDTKLLKCIRELRSGSGEAVTRVTGKGLTDLAPDLQAAKAAADARGLAVPS